MLVKFFWYIFSFLTVFLVLLNAPNRSNIGVSINQSQLFNLPSQHLFIQKVIAFNISMFFIFTILSLI
uniref:Preprotein-translocase subunit g n=1 Tax=Symphyocladiella dendroidea TaxID=2506487 RepID=A0A1Z1M7M9_9FLOR|nr:preprotein-translocase subunit g [Symphyocladiella dendroidea]ARW61893.1 preprotein-translocase subunit g [Symphyocladiella dendroidea]